VNKRALFSLSPSQKTRTQKKNTEAHGFTKKIRLFFSRKKVNDNRSSSTALLRNISEAESLKNRAEAQAHT
jgi:hypothetical protein